MLNRKNPDINNSSVAMFFRSLCSSFDYHFLHMTVLLAIYCLLHTCHGSCNDLDRDSLSLFGHRISAATPLNWSVSVDCCCWEGVGCDDSGRIATLWLPSKGLSGSISPSIRNLSSLSLLNLSHNWISGSLPDEFFSYFNHLQVVDLSSNRICGGISASDKLPAETRTFNLSNNHINGMIPSAFLETALNLESFDLSNNSFFGQIPSSVCSYAPSMQHIDLSINEFSGPIPPGFGHCLNLQSLRAGFNTISGEIPEDIYGLLKLQELHLPSNRLSGQMDERISNLVNLEILALHNNNLTGKMPQEVGRLSKLEELLLHLNQLSGTIPASLANCTRLVTLCLRMNFLEGKLSDFDFSKFVQLRVIDLGFNSFSGGLPRSLMSCKTLKAIRLAHNHLSGDIQPEIAELQSLSFLSISNSSSTNLTKALTILMECKSLRTLLLSSSFYNEKIPDTESLVSSGGFQNLQILSLRNNRLTGSIPLWLSKLTNLTILYLGGNCLTGSIPGWLGTLPNLFVLHLGDNQLSGHFPVELTRLQRLASEPKLEQAESSFFELPVFDGPSSTKQYSRVVGVPGTLLFSNNNISGSIPEEIGNLKSLTILKLDRNGFSGSIPATISNLTNLERLDLSRNRLSGKIPASLEKLNFLSYFSVSYNNLQGPVPTGGQFDTFSRSSFEGNPDLCGRPLQHPCQTPLSHGNEQRAGLKSTKEMINWLCFEISYAVSFILTVIAFLKVLYFEHYD